MSHIHIPDGVLPVWLWVLGYLTVIFLFIFGGLFSKKEIIQKKLALAGTFSALILLSASLFIIPPMYHLNLVALTGIVVGPYLSLVSVFIVNLILAFAGHGGITIVGLNTLVLTLEATVAYAGFKFLKKLTKKTFISVFLATFFALILSTFANAGIVYIGTLNFNEVVEVHHHDSHENHIETKHETDAKEQKFDLKKFLIFILTFGSAGLIIESLLTGFIINYVNKVKPDILNES